MKRFCSLLLLLLLLVLGCGFAVNTCVKSFAQTETSSAASSIKAEQLRSHVMTLADDRLEGRGAGYSGERRAAEYIAAEFKKIGLAPGGDTVKRKRTFFQEFQFQAMHPVKPWELLRSQNVIGFIEGQDSSKKKEIVVIGAHYDGQGRTGQADPMRFPASDKSVTDEIWNSANDNAASVATMLEIARFLKHEKIRPRRSIVFIAFGAEEHGMCGSMYYVDHATFPLADHVAMINMEKLGRSPGKPLGINGGGSSSIWPELLKAAQEETKAKIAFGNPFSFPESDHYPFSASKIPAIMLLAGGAADSHQPSDTADKIDYERVAEAGRYVMATLLKLADREDRPAFVASPIPDPGLSVHLATAAEADARGVPAPASGLKVTGVIAGLAAASAGLKQGDLIIEFGDYRFRRDDTLASLMTMHREVLEGKHGNRLKLKVIRNDKTLELFIDLKRG